MSCAPTQPGDVGRAAAENLHSLRFEQLARGQLQAAEMRGVEARLQSPAQHAADRVRLFGDLLTHEVREVALGQRFELPVDRERRARNGAAVEREGFIAVRANHGDIAVVEMHDVLRVAHERGDVGGNEHFPLANAENHGAAVTRDDDRVRPLSSR